jgi:hypothetical protein
VGIGARGLSRPRCRSQYRPGPGGRMTEPPSPRISRKGPSAPATVFTCCPGQANSRCAPPRGECAVGVSGWEDYAEQFKRVVAAPLWPYIDVQCDDTGPLAGNNRDQRIWPPSPPRGDYRWIGRGIRMTVRGKREFVVAALHPWRHRPSTVSIVQGGVERAHGHWPSRSMPTSPAICRRSLSSATLRTANCSAGRCFSMAS